MAHCMRSDKNSKRSAYWHLRFPGWLAICLLIRTTDRWWITRAACIIYVHHWSIAGTRCWINKRHFLPLFPIYAQFPYRSILLLFANFFIVSIAVQLLTVSITVSSSFNSVSSHHQIFHLSFGLFRLVDENNFSAKLLILSLTTLYIQF